MVVGAERDVERTREANNPNFIVGDLHSESHYQTTVPHARYNYAGVVAQQKCIEFSLFLSLSLPSSSLCSASLYLSAFPLLHVFFSPMLHRSSLSLFFSCSHVLYLHAFHANHLLRSVRILVSFCLC